MSKVLIITDHFKEASRLGSILDDRLAEVELLTADQLKAFKAVTGSRLVAASGLVDALGGMEALTAVARELRCDQMLIINSCADTFILKSEMNGKCLMLDLPEDAAGVNKQQSRARDYGLQLAATLICETFHVAAGDAATVTLRELAKRVAQTDVTVFINGPTGTGKEVLSKFIHHHSERKDQPFVAINCAAIPENMLEAILFGHEKGAFTGASTANKGIFRAADGGTLMLDEISEMPIGLQSKLLRVLQEKSVTPIGAQAISLLMCGLSPRQTAIWQQKFSRAVSVKTSITGLMFSPWVRQVWPNVPAIFCRSVQFFCTVTVPGWTLFPGLMKVRQLRFVPISGRAMYVSWKTSCNVRSC